MPVYQYKCRDCDNRVSATWDIATYEEMRKRPPICECQTKLPKLPEGRMKPRPMVRVFSFTVKTSMQEHHNHTTGQMVSSDKQFRDQLKRQSEEATIRTGIEHNFQPVDANDKQTFGVTNEGLDATYNRRKELGMRIPDAIKPGNMD